MLYKNNKTIAIFALTICATPSPALAAKNIDMEQSARGACMLFIKQVLHDPGSAEFESASYVKLQKSGDWIVQRHFRARNGYNALRSYIVECKMKYQPDQWKLLDFKQIQ